MQDSHAPPPDAGDAEAAELSYHAGIAADMDYGLWGSGAWLSPGALEAFENNFRYDQDAVHGLRDINRMTEEIQWLRPLELGGSDSSGRGHAWVIYGYNKGTDPNRQFLMNMGWGGASDGWYSCDSVPVGFTISQEQVTHIAPLSVVKFVGSTGYGDGSPANPYLNIEEALNAAPNGATLIFKAGSDNAFVLSTLVIDRPLTLRGKDVTIRRRVVSAPQ